MVGIWIRPLAQDTAADFEIHVELPHLPQRFNAATLGINLVRVPSFVMRIHELSIFVTIWRVHQRGSAVLYQNNLACAQL